MRPFPFKQLLVACGFGLALGAVHAVELRGFRGLMWGDTPEYLGAAQVVHDDGAVACYQREEENLLFGDSPLKAVRYCFRQGHFFLVTLEAAVGAEQLAAEFQGGYGRPDLSGPGYARWGQSGAPLVAEVLTPAPGGPASLRLMWVGTGR